MIDWRRLADDVYDNVCLSLLIAALVACAFGNWGLAALLASAAVYLGLLGGMAAMMTYALWFSGRGDE